MLLVRLANDHPDISAVKMLYEEAFPANERSMTIDHMLALSELLPSHISLELLGIYPDDTPTAFAGFILSIQNESSVYVLFFAICPEQRSSGIGGKAIQAFQELCGSKAIILEYESVYEASANAEQRLRRRSFYLKHGFYDTGWFLKDNGTEFAIACSCDTFNKHDYEALAAALLAGVSDTTPAPLPYRRDA